MSLKQVDLGAKVLEQLKKRALDAGPTVSTDLIAKALGIDICFVSRSFLRLQRMRMVRLTDSGRAGLTIANERMR